MRTVPRFEADLARWALGLLRDGQLSEVATRALLDGVESKSIAALAGESPSTGNPFVARDLFARGLRELGVEPPPAQEALAILLRWWLLELANGRGPALAALEGLMNEVYYPSRAFGMVERSIVGDALGVEKLVGIYWCIRDGVDQGCLSPED